MNPQKTARRAEPAAAMSHGVSERAISIAGVSIFPADEHCGKVLRSTGGISSAIPLKRWVLRTRPLRGQSRYYPNFLGHDAEEWWSFDHSSASSKDHSPKPKIAIF